MAGDRINALYTGTIEMRTVTPLGTNGYLYLRNHISNSPSYGDYKAYAAFDIKDTSINIDKCILYFYKNKSIGGTIDIYKLGSPFSIYTTTYSNRPSETKIGGIGSSGSGWSSADITGITAQELKNGIRLFHTTQDNTLSVHGLDTPDTAPYVVIEYSFNPTIGNLAYSGNYWENDITINWRSDYQSGFEYELYQNNIKIKDGSGGKNRNFIIPANTYTSKNNATCRVRTFYTSNYDGHRTYSNWQEISLNLKDIEATISNLIVNGDMWESPIALSWQSDNQEQFKIEILKDNSVVKTYTGETDKNYIIAAEQLGEGLHTFRVWVAYKNRFVNYTSKDITLKNIVPTISGLTLSGSNIDLDLTLSWESQNQQKYEVEIVKDTYTVETYSGTTSNFISIPAATLTTGLHKFRVRVGYKSRWSNWIEINATLVETLPSIGAFEPDGVICERDQEIRVWWTSKNQSKWKLEFYTDEVVSLTHTGTTETEKILPPATFTTGNQKMILTITYTTNTGIEKLITKKAEFIVQGKPPIPTITSSNRFTTSRPTIEWDTQDQEGWLLEILKEGNVIWSTDWQNGLITSKKLDDYLENGTYSARVRIINKYSIESEYGVKEFVVAAEKLSSIQLVAHNMEHYAILSWINSPDYSYYYIFRNGVMIGKTYENTYKDYMCNGECIYIVRGINKQDVFSDSNKMYLDCTIKRPIIALISNPDDIIPVGLMRGGYQFEGDINIEYSSIQLAGRQNPVTVFGEHNSNRYMMKFSTKQNLFKFLRMCNSRDVFIYRDKLRTLFISIPNPKYITDKFDTQISFIALEADYSEVIEYD